MKYLQIILSVIVTILLAPISIAASNIDTNLIKAVHGHGKYALGPNGHVYHEHIGNGPAVFIIAGGPGSDHTNLHGWFQFLLKDGYSIILLDNIGRGRSRKQRSTAYSVEKDVEDIEAVRKHLKFEKIYLIGHSYGGMPAIGYAQKYPQHTDKLIMSNGMYDNKSFQMNIDNVNALIKYRYPEKWEEILTLRSRGILSNDDHYQAIISSIGNDLYWYNSIHSEKLLKLDGQFNMLVYISMVGEDPEWQVTGSIRHISISKTIQDLVIKTLIIGGRHDNVTTPQISYRLYEMMNKQFTRYYIFENSGHRPWIEEATAYQKLVVGFLKEDNP